MKRLLAALLLILPFNGAIAMTDDEVKQGYKAHAALAQLHRWYQFYEHSDSPLENQLDILAKDVELSSALGEGKGHDDYKERVTQLPTAWKNAHFVKDASVTTAQDGTQTLTATITYLNQGMLPDNAVRSADLNYTTTLSPRDETVLPLFTKIAITPDSEGSTDAFEDAYPENRLRSVMHYWLALIEDPARNPAPAQEILAEDFSLNFSSGKITDFEGFKSWLAGPASQVAASTHMPSNISYEVLDEALYQLKVDFDWEGILPNGQGMTAKTRHVWTVTDDPSERFARIKSMDVEVLEPFAPKP